MSFDIQHVHIKNRQNFRIFHTPLPQHNEWNYEVRTRSSLRARNTSPTVGPASNKKLTRQKEEQMLGDWREMAEQQHKFDFARLGRTRKKGR